MIGTLQALAVAALEAAAPDIHQLFEHRTPLRAATYVVFTTKDGKVVYEGSIGKEAVRPNSSQARTARLRQDATAQHPDHGIVISVYSEGVTSFDRQIAQRIAACLGKPTIPV